MNLISKQKAFSQLVAKLLLECAARGYEVTIGEVWRSPEEAQRNATDGDGIPNSLHCVRLAIDLNLFRGGKFLTRSGEYREMGEYWKSLSTAELLCRWGGDFPGDGPHFSIEHNGVK